MIPVIPVIPVILRGGARTETKSVSVILIEIVNVNRGA
jgi:hypothetical protein